MFTSVRRISSSLQEHIDASLLSEDRTPLCHSYPSIVNRGYAQLDPIAFENRFYKVGGLGLTPAQTAAACSQDGATFVTLESPEQMAELKSFVQAMSMMSCINFENTHMVMTFAFVTGSAYGILLPLEKTSVQSTLCETQECPGLNPSSWIAYSNGTSFPWAPWMGEMRVNSDSERCFLVLLTGIVTFHDHWCNDNGITGVCRLICGLKKKS